MNSNQPTYFAQLTDIHVGNNNLNGEQAKRNLRNALAELEALRPRPRAVLVTADLVCSGRRGELELYCSLTRGARLDLYAIPANHDLWGEADDAAWSDLLGPRRHVVDMGSARVVMFDEMKRRPEGGWRAEASAEQLAWLDEQLAAPGPLVRLVAFHAPILREGDDYHDNWRGSNADETLDLFRRRGVAAMITGHWHRCGEWTTAGVRTINTGALVGWQWTGMPPYWSFPVRPGYRLFCVEGDALRTFWRELGSQEMRAVEQVALTHIGDAHTGGPRPQVRPVSVFASVGLRAQTWAGENPVDAVEWSLTRGDWRPMRKTWEGLWTEWEAELEWREARAGASACAVRALRGGRPVAYDAVPIAMSEWHSPPPAAALPGRETVFELFYTPE